MLVDGLRPMWLPTISDVDGAPAGHISDWVGTGQYYFDAPVTSTAATFVLTPGSSLLNLFAAEMSRFSSAAIETSLGISRPEMPKSVAWLFIQTYYAAFYAAHGILRSVGISASNFKMAECQKADAIAAALGFSSGPLQSAQYKCEYLLGNGRLGCSKAVGGGIHEQFWRIFDAFLVNTSQQILNSSLLPTPDAQVIFAKLTEFQSILRFGNRLGGNWLSTIRNEVTYMQQHRAWFPYGRTKTDCDQLFERQRLWLSSPDSIDLPTAMTPTAERFVTSCAFLVSLCVAVVRDMSSRCSNGTSFLRSGPLKLLNQVSQ
jgi:hypothetical protein